MKLNAIFSDDRVYRYDLTRIWDDLKPYVMFIGLNPFTADETKNDRIVDKCINYARDWGYGGLHMTNLFAYCTTKPEKLKASEFPLGEYNNHYLKLIAKDAGIILAVWGENGIHNNRNLEVELMFENLYCLLFLEGGQPGYPLFKDQNLKPIPYNFKVN